VEPVGLKRGKLKASYCMITTLSLKFWNIKEELNER
jgi:hypothetical protein